MLLAFGINQMLMGKYELPRLPLVYLPIGAVALWLLGQIAVFWPARRAAAVPPAVATRSVRSEEHTSELQSLMRISYAVFSLKKKTITMFSKPLITIRIKTTVLKTHPTENRQELKTNIKSTKIP